MATEPEKVERPRFSLDLRLEYDYTGWTIRRGDPGVHGVRWGGVHERLTARQALKLARRLGVEDDVRAVIEQQAAFAEQELRRHEQNSAARAAAAQEEWHKKRDQLLAAQADLGLLS